MASTRSLSTASSFESREEDTRDVTTTKCLPGREPKQHVLARRHSADGCAQRKLSFRKPVSLDKAICRDDAPIEVLPGLFIGSIHCAFNDAALKTAGITHIINATGLPATFPRLFTYLTLGLRDKEYANLFACIPLSNTFIHSVHKRAAQQQLQYETHGNNKHADDDNVCEDATDDNFGAVLVHCSFGRSRSAALVVAYLMQSRGLSYQAALDLVKGRRPVVSMNTSFQEQLRCYESAGCDAHAAHQLFLRARAQSRSERDTPRTRAHRPSATAQFLHPKLQPVLLPRMLAMDLEFACRGCRIPLFHAADVLVRERVQSQAAKNSAHGAAEVLDKPQDNVPFPQSEMSWAGIDAQRERAESFAALALGSAKISHDIEALVRHDTTVLHEMLLQPQLPLGQPLPWMPRDCSASPRDSTMSAGLALQCPGCSATLGCHNLSESFEVDASRTRGCKIDAGAVIVCERR